MAANAATRRRPGTGYPGSLTDLSRYRKTAHGHDGSSRVVMVRKTDQRTFASNNKDGQGPHLETITRETIETFRGERTECKFTTTEKNNVIERTSPSIDSTIVSKIKTPTKRILNNGVAKFQKKINKMDFENECLKAHNEYRKLHGVAPLKLNKEISRISQDWANKISRRGGLEHSNNNQYGENIFYMSSSNPNFTVLGKEPVDSWYSEIKKHTFGVEPRSLATGHFTQVVWKNTKELGVGVARANKSVYVVCNYYPPGNYIGSYSQNVPPVGGFMQEKNNNSYQAVENFTATFERLELDDPKDGSKKYPGTSGNFETDFLDRHNKYRAQHGVPLLNLDKDLCKYSQEWAKILASKGTLEHRKNSPHGENIYCICSTNPNFTISGNEPVDKWYEEIKLHPFGREPTSLKSGHFTQVVWKTSEKLGVGVAKSRQGQIYVVANYSPPGNFVGDYTKNVLPLRSGDASCSDAAQAKEVVPSPVKTDAAASNSTFTKFARDALKVHNDYRRKHGVPELTLSEELCDYANEWAERIARECRLAHRPKNQYGENIFYMYSSDFNSQPTAQEVCKSWYDEIKDHTFNTETINMGTLHFTQIVWKDTKQLGIALAKNGAGQTYVVANYSPRGNVMGSFKPNVPRPRC